MCRKSSLTVWSEYGIGLFSQVRLCQGMADLCRQGSGLFLRLVFSVSIGSTFQNPSPPAQVLTGVGQCP